MVERGELLTTLPAGAVRSSDNRCEKDPDTRVQHVIHLVFSKFAETGSIRQTLLWFRAENMSVPRLQRNAHGSGIQWQVPVYGTLHKMLLNPIYADAYAYGRTYTRTTVEDGHARKTRGHRQEQEPHAPPLNGKIPRMPNVPAVHMSTLLATIRAGMTPRVTLYRDQQVVLNQVNGKDVTSRNIHWKHGETPFSIGPLP